MLGYSIIKSYRNIFNYQYILLILYMRNAQFSIIILVIYLISFTDQYKCTENSELSDL